MKKYTTYLQFLLESPISYPGNINYLPDDKFPDFSINNINSYDKLGEDDDFMYYLNTMIGYVFSKADVEKAATNSAILVKPVMRVGLREYPALNLMQAHYLRIREKFKHNRCASTWYKLYAKYAGGVVSDNEHLAGGRLLWTSFIKTGKCSVYNPETNTLTPVTIDDVNKIWSVHPNKDKRSLVLVYKP